MKGILVLLTVLTLSIGFFTFNMATSVEVNTVERPTEEIYTNY